MVKDQNREARPTRNTLPTDLSENASHTSASDVFVTAVIGAAIPLIVQGLAAVALIREWDNYSATCGRRG